MKTSYEKPVIKRIDLHADDTSLQTCKCSGKGFTTSSGHVTNGCRGWPPRNPCSKTKDS
jgi:hypothetical protein